MKGSQKKTTTEAERRYILKIISNSSDFVAKIKAKSCFRASISTVRRITKSFQHLVLKKPKPKCLTEGYKATVLEHVTCVGKMNRNRSSTVPTDLIFISG
uniref:Uncharacterized protein n=1 Tax=Bactrocera dorsalis TaxID=27457 RepID=A0A034VDN9_BACDO